MIRSTRVIPILLLHNSGVYKTTKFSKPKYIGDPINAIRLFNDLEVDEILVLDIDASKNNSPPNFELIEDLASEAFMPFSYGGGISNSEQAKKIINSGIEKLVINYGFQKNHNLINEISKIFGSQSVIVSIDYKKKILKGEMCYDHVNCKMLNFSPIEAAIIAENSGAGEIMVNSVDRDGSMKGLDLNFICEISKKINIPLIACGGAGNLKHLKEAKVAGADAIAAGSMFVYHGNQNAILINYPTEEQLELYLN